MYKYLVGFVLLSPLIGILLVESGEYALSIGVVGYPNGAGQAYAFYATTVALVAWLSSGRFMRIMVLPSSNKRQFDAKLSLFATNLLWFNVVFLLVFLFGFGAIKVLVGEVGKGDFRTGLGVFGAFPNLMTKFILPALLAYAVALFQRTTKGPQLRLLITCNFALLFIIGAAWGFKTTSFMVLLPSLLLIYWRTTFGNLFWLLFIFIITLIFFFYLFDAQDETNPELFTFLLNRITIIQGDVAWYVWDKYISGETFPSYWPTLLAIFGDKILTLFGLSRSNFEEWTLYHYDLLITSIAGVPLVQIENGHSITATPFAEGIVAGGLWGVTFFSIAAGLIVGRLYAYIQRSLMYGQDFRAALASTYFCLYVFSWLNGGAVLQLVHISLWIAFIATFLAYKLIKSFGSKISLKVH